MVGRVFYPSQKSKKAKKSKEAGNEEAIPVPKQQKKLPTATPVLSSSSTSSLTVAPSAEFKAQSRMFGIALMGVGVKCEQQQPSNNNKEQQAVPQEKQERKKAKKKKEEKAMEKHEHDEQQQAVPKEKQERKKAKSKRQPIKWDDGAEQEEEAKKKKEEKAMISSMNYTVPSSTAFFSLPFYAGLTHSLPRRRPRILTTLDGSRTIAPFFTNAFAFSNHFKCHFIVEGLEFCCTEQFYMYYKARVFGDEACAVDILRAQDPKAIKRFGSQIRLFDTTKWRHVSILVMLIGNWKKYEQNPMLRQLLFETGDALLVEASPDDTYWGCGVHVDNTDMVRDMVRWRGRGGKNVLGRLLTRLRETFKEREQYKQEWEEVRLTLPALYNTGSNAGGMPRRTI